MCGICGVVGLHGPELGLNTLALRQGLSHRGPDGEGIFLDHDSGTGLGHTRLAIVDLSSQAQQPLPNEDETVWAVCNGEIYNHRSIRSELEARGHRFRSQTDSEVLVHLFEEYGERLLERLDGMFAFGLWDARQRILLLARDRLGKKPLYYTLDGGNLCFASEVKALLRISKSPRELEPSAMCSFLHLGYVPGAKTLLRGVAKLRPGHLLLWRGGRVAVHEYWSPPEPWTSTSPATPDSEKVRDLVSQAVEKRLMSDVPVGAFLSGGIDSSIIVGLMSGRSNRPVSTFSVGYEVGDRNEKYNVDLEAARRVAKHYGCEHHEVILDHVGADLVRKVCWALDEPIANPTALPLYVLSNLASQHVKVVLSGDGSDEIFGGYERYGWDRFVSWYRFLPGKMRRSLEPFISAIAPRVRGLTERASLDRGAERYFSWWKAFTWDELAGLLRDSPAEECFEQVVSEQLPAWLGEPVGPGFEDRLAGADLRMWLAEESNMCMDKLCMSNSLEPRSPYLDYKLVEYAAALPLRLKCRRGFGKDLLKQAFADLLPSFVLQRPKWGFLPPAVHWSQRQLRPLFYELLAPERLIALGFRETNLVSRILDSHMQGRENRLDALWRLLTLSLWAELYLGEESSSKTEVAPSFEVVPNVSR